MSERWFIASKSFLFDGLTPRLADLETVDLFQADTGRFLTHSRGGRQPEFLRDFSCADRRADLNEQAMRLAELGVAGCFIARKSSQLGTLDVEEGLVALRARHLEPCVGFAECSLDFFGRPLNTLGLSKSA